MKLNMNNSKLFPVELNIVGLDGKLGISNFGTYSTNKNYSEKIETTIMSAYIQYQDGKIYIKDGFTSDYLIIKSYGIEFNTPSLKEIVYIKNEDIEKLCLNIYKEFLSEYNIDKISLGNDWFFDGDTFHIYNIYNENPISSFRIESILKPVSFGNFKEGIDIDIWSTCGNPIIIGIKENSDIVYVNGTGNLNVNFGVIVEIFQFIFSNKLWKTG